MALLDVADHKVVTGKPGMRKLGELYDTRNQIFLDHNNEAHITTDEHQYVSLKTGIIYSIESTDTMQVQVLPAGDVLTITVNGNGH